MRTSEVHAPPVDVLSVVNGHEYLLLTTYRKSGEPVATPVWFARSDDKLYVMTMRSSGKAKRLAQNPQVRIAPCDRIGQPLGSTLDTQAHLITAVDERLLADAVLSAKYGEQKKSFDLRLTDPTERVYIAIAAR